MAEYMDISRIDDWDNLSIIDDDGNAKYVYDVGELPKADVVERSEYDKMVLAFRARVENQKDNLIATRNAYYQIEKEEVELRSKIDEAIKIAEDYISTNFKLGLNERAFGMREILEIFVRNIGE